jgi:5-methylcytosine-specific restriction protein A
MFQMGEAYKRTDLHVHYGGQRQGGISTPKDHPFIFLFTGQSGDRYGYRDEWEDGVFHYTGEGQAGDMQFKAGNKAIRDHSKNGKALYLFQQVQQGFVRFQGEFALVSYEYRQAKDKNETARRLIVFYLRPVSSEDEAVGFNGDAKYEISVSRATADLAELRRRAYEAASNVGQCNPREGNRRYYERSKSIREYVLARSKGKCEACKKAAPFTRNNGTFYLEPHHIKMISESGLDHPYWVAAVCPNCHREVHHGRNGKDLNATLQGYILSLEYNNPDGAVPS